MNSSYFKLLLMAMIFLAACKDDEVQMPQQEYLIFGHYYGLCGGEDCVEIFKLENGELFEDTNDNYPPDTFYSATYIQLSSAKYNLVKDLPSKIPAQLLNESNGTLGMPDAYDQGGYYLELFDSGNRRFWRLDTDTTNLPSYLFPFTDTLKAYIHRISD